MSIKQYNSVTLNKTFSAFSTVVLSEKYTLYLGKKVLEDMRFVLSLH